MTVKSFCGLSRELDHLSSQKSSNEGLMTEMMAESDVLQECINKAETALKETRNFSTERLERLYAKEVFH